MWQYKLNEKTKDANPEATLYVGVHPGKVEGYI
jgi:hypothetical protein